MTSNNIKLEKVTTFVMRGFASERELLVFRHPSSGIQLPAGTVEEGESIEEAALRETREETGLSAVSIVSYLGAQVQPMRPNELILLRRAPLLQRPESDSPAVIAFPSFLGLRRGQSVRHIGNVADKDRGYTQVAYPYEEFDGPAHEATAPSRFVTGWVDADAISENVTRHFFHLTPTEPTLHSWIQIAEEWGLRFELYWVPLPSSSRSAIVGLVPSQAAWLAAYAERLCNIEGESGTEVG